MTIAERLNENLKIAQETAGPYVESARKNAGVAFAQVQEKLGRGHTGGMHHSASSKDVTVRHFIEPNSGSQLAPTSMFCSRLQLCCMSLDPALPSPRSAAIALFRFLSTIIAELHVHALGGC